MDKPLKGRLTLANTTKPAPEDFYASLADEQGARLSTPTATLWGEREQSLYSALGADEVRASCVLALDQRVRTRLPAAGT